MQNSNSSTCIVFQPLPRHVEKQRRFTPHRLTSNFDRCFQENMDVLAVVEHLHSLATNPRNRAGIVKVNFELFAPRSSLYYLSTKLMA